MDLSPAFERLHAPLGRPSIDPAGAADPGAAAAGVRLGPLRAPAAGAALGYDLLCRWFVVGLGIDDPVWDVTVFTGSRGRPLDGDIAGGVRAALLNRPEVGSGPCSRTSPSRSTGRCSVDGTLLRAWAGMRSLRPKDGSGEPPSPGRNGERDLHGERGARTPRHARLDGRARGAARLVRRGKGKEARLGPMGRAPMENRHGLIIAGRVSEASGTAERGTRRRR